MKKFVLLFAVVFSVNVFDCVCGNWGKQFDSYSSTELVADVTITKVYPILKGKYSDKYFKIDLKYNELYKQYFAKNFRLQSCQTLRISLI